MKQKEDFSFFRGLLNGLGISILLWIGILSAIYKAFF